MEIDKDEILGLLDDANDEMKRAEHQIDVSLKYTRTVDVLMNVILRMIDGYERLFDTILALRVQQQKIDMLPPAPILKGQKLKEIFPDDELVDQNVELFFLLMKLSRTNPEREQEYRRHVTMRTIVDGREEIVNIDIINEYFNLMKNFFEFICRQLRAEDIVGELNRERI